MPDQDDSDSDSFVHQDSSSDANDWDEDEVWVVDSISEEYHPPRGSRYFKFDWGQWKHADGTSHTWEPEGSVASRDARRTIKNLDRERVRAEIEAAKDPFVAPYHPYQVPEDQDDANEDTNMAGVPAGKAKPKKAEFVYLFTEIPQQAHKLFIDAKLRQFGRRPVGLSEALPVAQEIFNDFRERRQERLDELDINIQTAAQEGQLGLGPAILPSDANRPRIKTNSDMQQRMSNLQIKEIYLPSQNKSISPSTASTPTLVDSPASPIVPTTSRTVIVRPKPFIVTPQNVPFMGPTPQTGIQFSPPTANDLVVSWRSDSTPSTTAQPTTSKSKLVNSIESRLKDNRRQILQHLWSTTARQSGAAGITVANEVNDEDIPPVGPGFFKYLEKTYFYGDNIPPPDPSFFHSCECPNGTCDPETCACQEDSMIFDDDDNKVFVYNTKGLYAFDRQVSSYVFECNEKCSCGPNCPSRVAQKPRSVPIEIFRTVDRGWGIRSPHHIAKGTVLGLYTGTLLKRTTARELPAEDSVYLCDLDFHEDAIGDEVGYTVDANNMGNWTRFVNHSCDASCMLYAIIYDSVPEVHQPKLALVAKRDIIAFMEITVDYSPNSDRRGKGKQKITANSVESTPSTGFRDTSQVVLNNGHHEEELLFPDVFRAESWIHEGLEYVKDLGNTYIRSSHPILSAKYQLRANPTSPSICDPSVKQYSGYFDIATSAKGKKSLFYWFFESRSSPSDDPVVLWLNGGPGCSSLTGLLFELGPCSITANGANTTINEHGWNSHANVIFLDQPINVGFSYSTDGSSINNTPDAALDVWAFLQLFFQQYPHYAKLPFHLAAESYGGIYGPNIASVIYKKNNDLNLAPIPDIVQINLESVMLGNGLSEPLTQFASIPDFACEGPYPVWSDPDGPECEALRGKVPWCQRLIQACYDYDSKLACVPAALYCWSQLYGSFQTLGLNPYDVRRECNREDNPLCYKEMKWIELYLNNPEIKAELNVPEQHLFRSCNMEMNQAFMTQGDSMHNAAALLPVLLENGVRVLVYAGVADFMCNFMGNELWVSKLENLFQDEYVASEKTSWVLPGNSEPSGYFHTAGQGAGNLTFVAVYDAGHMVPYDQPEAALNLLESWIFNIPLPTTKSTVSV